MVDESIKAIEAAIVALCPARTEAWDWHPHGAGFALMSGANALPGPGPEWSRMRHGFNILSATQSDAFDAGGPALRAYIEAVQPEAMVKIIAWVRELEAALAPVQADGFEHWARKVLDALAYLAPEDHDMRRTKVLQAFYRVAQGERAAVAERLAAIPIDDLRDAGMQDDASHEAMRALFVAAARGQK